MFTRVTLKSPSGNVKTRFQFGQCAAQHPVKVIAAICEYAVIYGMDVTITYTKAKICNREKDEMERVNRILDQVA